MRQASSRGERHRSAHKLRDEGKTFTEIAQILRARHAVSARAAMRMAHGWTQQEAADQWNRRWPSKPKDKKQFSYWERWPNAGRAPSLPDLNRLAQLYQCAVADLLADLDYQFLDPNLISPRPEIEPASGRHLLPGKRVEHPVDTPLPSESGRPDGPDEPVPAPAGTADPSVQAWRAGEGTAEDLEVLVASYRRAYAGETGVRELLPVATGLMHLLTDLGRRHQWPRGGGQLASLIGQTAVLVGLLQLMGHRDLYAARRHYNLALQTSYDAEDWDLGSYVLGSLSFEAVSDQRLAEARGFRDAAWDLASRRANPRTRAWVAALGSELHARDGDDAASRRLLDEAHSAMSQTRDQPSWKGVGWFDEVRLDAYEGGNLLILGRYDVAAEHLRRSLDRLDRTRLKHRCTLSADLALALVHLGEIDEACTRAGDALTLVTEIAHQESLDRVRRVHTHLLRWRDRPAVRELTERLEAA